MITTSRGLLRYRAFDSTRLSVFRLPTGWVTVDPTRPIGECVEHFDTHAEAIASAVTAADARARRGAA